MSTNKNPVVSGANRTRSLVVRAWQRIAANRRWVGLAAVVVLVAVGIGLMARSGLPYRKAYDAVSQTVSLAPPTVEDLQRAVKNTPKDAKAHEQLGRAYFSKGMHRLALAEYDRALNLDPRLPSDDIATDAVACFGSPEQTSAANLVATYRLVQAQEPLEKLTASRQLATRETALVTLQRMGRADHSDYLRVWTLNLESTDCDTRRHALAQLGDLGDRRALAPIKAARAKDDQSTPWYKFRCIGGRADDAQKKILSRHDVKAHAVVARR
jgi:tetratricopeptide (TPR) repeat protein